ncbi:spore coat protein X [Oceanobacillus oncorhynchi subsp. incaldanensis]|uniref:Spore coat protein X n=2 Tax=Oceanobacillus TaxID=182709 RepID=A0A0A1MRZ6_9BACI|nr:spore coat protein [Oceanobacillus oncorhynchi]MDM8100158.1 spore coat protein [Oceanobacillus oncorhynchi]UUI41022.1 spore coat protein [Oceanobacillus oncorhynchi]GIO19857.1 spore coat protein X [Oceanobacillus oncorhynchi subsp. incaldanensis]CEI82469.1 Spore coat protein X [Oceanobacillus oncorhynchi]
MSVYRSKTEGTNRFHDDLYGNDYACQPEENACDTKDNQYAPAYYDNSFSPNFGEASVVQTADEFSYMEQESAEVIWVKESCNINVNSTDTQIGASLQAALQLAISIVIRLSIADSGDEEAVEQELMQTISASQVNKQKIFIYNTKDATVTTTDTDISVNIQLLLQILIALVIMIDIL